MDHSCSAETPFSDDCDVVEYSGTWALFGAHQDKDFDGIPDVEEMPLDAKEFTSHAKRLQTFPTYPPMP